MVDLVEARPSHPNALAKRLYAEKFFKSSDLGNSNPTGMISEHEQWLATELEGHGVKVDDRTWSNFYDNAIGRSLDQKNAKPTGNLQAQTFESVGNILQALAWYHCPEGASWKTPEISFQLQSPIFIGHDEVVEAAKSGRARNNRRWMGPSEKYKSDLTAFGYQKSEGGVGEFVFGVNEHYKGVTGWLRRKDGAKLHGVRCYYDCQTNVLKVSFANPNEFMGWTRTEDHKQYVEEDRSKLVYTLQYLHQFIGDLTKAVSNREGGRISVETWRAY